MLNYGVRMRPSFRPAAVALVLAAALSASGCTPDASGKPPASTPSATALFASDEEALAAAEEAYRAYLAKSDQITAESGTAPGRIDSLVSPDLKPDIHLSFSKFEQGNLHTEGNSTFDSVTIQSVTDNTDGTAVVDVYLCLDFTGVRVFTGSGEDVTPRDRTNRLPMSIRFLASESGLRLEGSETWSGENFCS